MHKRRKFLIVVVVIVVLIVAFYGVFGIQKKKQIREKEWRQVYHAALFVMESNADILESYIWGRLDVWREAIEQGRDFNKALYNFDLVHPYWKANPITDLSIKEWAGRETNSKLIVETAGKVSLQEFSDIGVREGVMEKWIVKLADSHKRYKQVHKSILDTYLLYQEISDLKFSRESYQSLNRKVGKLFPAFKKALAKAKVLVGEDETKW